ncbi:MAG: hypothetical protein H6706_28905 [Myxococcales bacterium]|nr:hypothetical protein [Myxococcales bacterium]
MLAKRLADFEARTVDATQAGLPLADLWASLAEAPDEAAATLRLLRAYAPIWAAGGTRPPPASLEGVDLQALSPEALAELRAAIDAGVASGQLAAPSGATARELPGTGWREAFIGGSASAEEAHYARIAEQIRAQQALQAEAADGRPRRAFHAKGLGLKARFTVATDLAPELRVGLFQPGAAYDAVVRLSNAADADDREPNLHGLAVRIADGSPTGQDFLCTSAPVSHVADAAGQAEVGLALAHGTLKGALKLLFSRGPVFTVKVLSTLSKQTKTRATSLAALSYYSRAPFRFGPVAARFLFRPVNPGPAPGFDGPHRLTADLTHRLKAGPLRWELALQRFVSEAATPIEQGDAAWPLDVAPAEVIGTLEIPAQDVDGAAEEALARDVEGWSFSPFNTVHHTPLGRLNRGRRVAYDASVAGRGGR